MGEPITREQGYELSAGKERRALKVAEQFLADVVGISVLHIGGADDNYMYGDFLVPSGETIEVKGQEIDPDRYEQNFVEVCEVDTGTDRHRGGLAKMAGLLGIDVARIASARVRLRDGSTTTFGHPTFVSVSIQSMTVASYTMFVNWEDDGRHIYLYEHDEICAHLLRGIDNGMFRGWGKSNRDTLAVFTPKARMRWARIDGCWRAHGVDMSRELHGRLREP